MLTRRYSCIPCIPAPTALLASYYIWPDLLFRLRIELTHCALLFSWWMFSNIRFCYNSSLDNISLIITGEHNWTAHHIITKFYFSRASELQNQQHDCLFNIFNSPLNLHWNSRYEKKTTCFYLEYHNSLKNNVRNIARYFFENLTYRNSAPHRNNSLVLMRLTRQNQK